MTETKSKKWNNETVATLLGIVGSTSPVSVDLVEQAATTLGVTARSIASKLRQLDHDVASMAKAATPTFTHEQGDALAAFVKENAGKLTYKEIAEQFQAGVFSAKQVQGKLLALELTSSVRPADKIEVATKYNEAEEATFIKMATNGKFIEEIAVTLGKTVASARGKALSLSRKGLIEKIPAQKEHHAKNTVDPVEALGASIATMTVAEIAAATKKSDRGIKTLLTRRGIKVADYDGVAKKAKAEGKRAA
jgi:transposase